MHKVFVYGSLKKGFGNHRFLEDSKYLGEFVTVGSHYHMFSLGSFPGVVREITDVLSFDIHGELYEVDHDVFRSLDLLESNGSFYTRQYVEVCNDEEGYLAWMYLLPSSYLSHVDRKNGVEQVGCFQSWVKDYGFRD